MIDALQALDRNAFEGIFRDFRDLLLADAFALSDRFEDLNEELGRWPTDSLSPAARRWLETVRVSLLQQALEADDWTRAVSIWDALAQSSPIPPLLRSVTERVAPPLDRADRREPWRRQLLATRARLTHEALAKVVDDELARLDSQAD